MRNDDNVAAQRTENFPFGGGEMGRLIGSMDWSNTLLGGINAWPQSLRTAVSICVNSAFPVLICWGESLVEIYNGAFCPIAEAMHPFALGKRAAEVWGESWNKLEPALHSVLYNGETISAEDQSFLVSRNGCPEECYFTFSYSPIYKDAGGIGGVFMAFTETTKDVNARKKIEESEEQLKMAMQATKLGTWEFYPQSGKLNLSPECKGIYGLQPESEIDFNAFAAYIHPDDKHYVTQTVEQAMDPAGDGVYNAGYRILRFDNNAVRWIKAAGKIHFNDRSEPERFIGTVVDITQQKLTEEKLRENEQRVRLAIDAGDLGTFDWNLEGDCFFSSDRLVEIFGLKGRQNITHQHLIDLFHPDDLLIRNKAVEDSVAMGGLVYEARIIWPDKSTHWVKVHGKIIYAPDHTPSRMYGIVMDITKQKNEEEILEKSVYEKTLSIRKKNEALKSSEERYHKMIDEVEGYAIILLDQDGFIQNWNKGAEKIKGYKEAEIIGKNFRTFYLPEDRQNMLPEKLINEAVTTGKAMHEGWRLRKDGTTFWGSIIITALHNEQNEIIGFSKVTRDLTERKIAEDKMRQYTADLEFQNRELEQFAYVASHDLQEPLRKIRTFSDLLQKSLDDVVTTAKYAAKIASSAERMSALIKSVLNYSRLSNGSDEYEQVDLGDVLEEVKTDFELMISEKKGTIKSNRLPVVKGNPLQLNQLFSNLIGNALKFSDKPPDLRISSRILSFAEISDNTGLQEGMNYVELVFTDNGIGFEQKYAAKIFTIFQRLHGYQDYNGTGIGLALCKKIVTNHQGSISVKSEVGIGTSFYIYFPYYVQSTIWSTAPALAESIS